MKNILLQVGALLITVSFSAFLNPRHLSLCESAFFWALVASLDITGSVGDAARIRLRMSRPRP